jgi:cation diffusion facilitator CzcD-associated flavoprotein CzcO
VYVLDGGSTRYAGALMDSSELLVIGAGPYGVATAARAIERGIETIIVGEPMSFWKQHMPERMCLRSGPDWHLDASGVHTFEAFLEEEGIAPNEVDPVPIRVFLDYATWFQDNKSVIARENLVAQLTHNGKTFEAHLANGERIASETVVAAPGIRHFQQLPPWANSVPPGVGSHTCDLVQFEDLRGARVLIVGGRQSAYEWAALIGEEGAERIDIVHRHDVPLFERVSWRFVDDYVDSMLDTPGWWRTLSSSERERIATTFWEVGRLTLEWWLIPRLATDQFHRWPGTWVVDIQEDTGVVVAGLSNGKRLSVDRIVFATGYKANLPNVPYLGGLVDKVDMVDGFPVLDEAFQSSIAGLYITGFAATRDFGPFLGFTKACPAAATLIVESLLRRA